MTWLEINHTSNSLITYHTFHYISTTTKETKSNTCRENYLDAAERLRGRFREVQSDYDAITWIAFNPFPISLLRMRSFGASNLSPCRPNSNLATTPRCRDSLSWKQHKALYIKLV